MISTGMLLLIALATPFALLLACGSRTLRDRMPALLVFAPLPALATALLAVNSPPLVFDEARLHITFVLDGPGAILLGVAALLWSVAGLYVATYLRGQPNLGRFSIYWLLTLTGSLGVFVTADLFTFYLAFAMVSLAAYGLVVFDGTPKARRAGIIYLVLALLGEIFLLMGFVLLAAAAPGDSLVIRDAVAALPASPWRDPTLALLIAGFGLKMGLVPLHVWLPIAHPAAPMPASAVLSGAIIKAGVIGLIRFLPFDVPLLEWGVALTAIGLFTAFYSVLIGITQLNPKTVLAYSSVSQMGVVATVIGMGLAAGQTSAVMATVFYAAHHLLAKGALFLAVGVVAATGPRRLWWVLAPAAILALGVGGLPLTGGALAKLAVKPVLGDGLVELLATLSAIGTTLLMLHFLHRLAANAAPALSASVPVGLVLPWMLMFVAAIVVPWTLYSMTGIGRYDEALQPKILWAALWPILIGAGLALALWRWGRYLPQIPEGDIVVVGQPALRVVVRCEDALARVEGVLRQWPAASLSLLVLMLILGGAMFSGH
ncbi:MAG TPA: proton-conducting transporter membrane subunit [Candidatus Competibacteraceae bacterium]|nr:proton-conducting transporter membrane subunit [Candidatus Competibacteraceae bacterium]HRZ06127.1 proton-conducting transporter membrane subunit [Candidatus Competibacteraceae bacterium]HSA45931.1 proton-conducting transporter membrane subunit [Candidatus Competibacteraceae bacterium]